MSDLAETDQRQTGRVMLDIEIIKSQIDVKGDDGSVGSYQLKQLEQQNEWLKDALLKLRDISANDKSEIQSLQKELEMTQSEYQEMEKIKEKLIVKTLRGNDNRSQSIYSHSFCISVIITFSSKGTS